MARGKKIDGGLEGLSKLKPQNSNKYKTKRKNQNQGYKIKDSFDISKTKIPKDTREVLKDFKEFDNFYLKLNKYARFEGEKPIFFKTERGKVEFSIYPNFGDFNFKENIEAQEQIAKSLFDKNIYKKPLTTTYRLKIGGEESIYEVNFKLHHIYGIPYIPSSAIKGVVRSYFEQEGELEKYIDLFGDEEGKGKIIFFDAFPTTKPNIKIDIMNPHYGHYYNEGKAPTDTNNPIPINFLTVEDTEFQFLIGSKEKIDDSFEDLFKEALENHGIGGKTAVGYGYFS